MRSLSIAALAVAIATPAFAEDIVETAVGTYTYQQEEICELTVNDLNDGDITLDADISMDVSITCNTEFNVDVAGEDQANPRPFLRNISGVETTGSNVWSSFIIGTMSKAASNTNNTRVPGEYRADKDFDPEIVLNFGTPPQGLAAGDYEGDVTITVTGLDVTS